MTWVWWLGGIGIGLLAWWIAHRQQQQAEMLRGSYMEQLRAVYKVKI